MKTFLCAILIAVLVGWLYGCASSAERLADKCYAFGGKPHVRTATADALDVDCK